MTRARGFTLFELAIVVGLIGLLITLTAPDYGRLTLRARTLEARAMLDTIANAERAFRRDHGKFIACAPSTPQLPKGGRVPFVDTGAGWRELGVRSTGPGWYRYEVRLTESGSFVAEARGDLDGNGQASLFSLDGRTHTLTITDELE